MQVPLARAAWVRIPQLLSDLGDSQGTPSENRYPGSYGRPSVCYLSVQMGMCVHSCVSRVLASAIPQSHAACAFLLCCSDLFVHMGMCVHSCVVRAADCRSAAPLFKPGCALAVNNRHDAVLLNIDCFCLGCVLRAWLPSPFSIGLNCSIAELQSCKVKILGLISSVGFSAHACVRHHVASECLKP